MGANRKHVGLDVVLKNIGRWVRYSFTLVQISVGIGILSGLVYFATNVPIRKAESVLKYGVSWLKYSLVSEQKYLSIMHAIERDLKQYEPRLYEAFYLGLSLAGLTALVLGAIFWRAGKKEQRDSYLRGARIIRSTELAKTLKSCAKFGQLNGYHIGKDKIKVPEEYVWRSFAIAGRPGTGKSVFIKHLLEQDRQRKVKAFIIDLNGEYWQRFGRPGKDKILSLRYKESEYWDFWAEDIVPELMASYLVPETGGNSFFWKAARNVVSSILRRTSSLDELRRELEKPDGELIEKLREVGELSSKVLGKEGSGQAAGVLGTTVLDFSFLKDLGYWPKVAGKDKAFSITKWALSDDDSWIFVPVRDDELGSIRTLIGIWFNLAIHGCFKRPEDDCYAGKYPSIRIVLDELKTLGRLEEMEKAGERLRKHRACIITGYQNNAQLEAIYGQHGAENLKDVLQNKVIFSIGDSRAQEELSKILGESEVDEVSASDTYGGRDSNRYSQTRKVTQRRVVLPSEIGELRDGDCFIKMGPFNPIRTSIPLKKWPLINEPLEHAIPPDSKRSIDSEGSHSLAKSIEQTNAFDTVGRVRKGAGVVSEPEAPGDGFVAAARRRLESLSEEAEVER